MARKDPAWRRATTIRGDARSPRAAIKTPLRDARSRKRRVKTSARLAAAGAALLVGFAFAAGLNPERLWDERMLLAAARAELTLSEMTIGEKLALTHGPLGAPWGGDPKPAGAIGSAGYVPGAPRLGVPALQETDAELGVANPGNIRRGDTATAMPSNLALASTWNVDLARRQGESVGSEARAKGFTVLLGGTANLIRDPRGGRNFEYFSEDPWLTGVMAGATIAGVQSQGLIATTKHYALNAQESDRMILDARIDPQAARQSDLLAFEIAIERGRPLSVMCAYNKVNGAYSCENNWLINGVLKGDWRYPGFVMSDWGAVHSTVAAALAGLDQESGEQMDTESFFSQPLARAVSEGRVPQARVDDMARRILTAIFASGLYDHPTITKQAALAESRDVALDVARQGVVLLQNDGLLPLDKGVKRIAVFGCHADRGVLSGGGSSQVTPLGSAGATAATDDPDFVEVFDPSSPVDAFRREFPEAAVSYDEGGDASAAARTAAGADVAIVFACQWMTETKDAPNLKLPGRQDELIDAVARANPKTVVVLETGGPVLAPWRESVAAILEAWYSGQSGGPAIAEVISGATNPSGRLPVTFPRAETQLPHPTLFGDRNPAASSVTTRGGSYGPAVAADYWEGDLVGYKWFVSQHERPLFPFGFGLSYSQFKLSDLSLNTIGDQVSATLTVANVGERAGAAVVQGYLSRSPDPRIPMRLAGFTRLDLKPGEEKRVDVPIDPRLFATFDEQARRWRIGAGAYLMSFGFDAEHADLSADFRLEAAELPP